MTNEEKQKAEQIVNNQWQWIAEFIERNNLSKEDRNQIRFKMYDVCCEMSEWKENQMIEKVEKVLGNLLFDRENKIYRAYLDYDAFFNDFRKAMEE